MAISLPKFLLGLNVGGGAKAFTPSDVTSAPVLEWWDATALATITQSGGKVSAWAGKNAVATMVQATGASQPAYNATGLNGFPTITGDGLATNLAMATVPAGFASGASPSWILVVTSQAALVADTTVRKAYAYGNQSVAHGSRQLDRVVVSAANRGSSNDTTTTVNDTTVDFSGIHVAIARFSGTSNGISVDGNTEVTAAAALATTNTRMRAFADLAAVPVGFYNGSITHIIVGNGVLSDSDKAKLEGWALWSIGEQALLPPGHPYASHRP